VKTDHELTEAAAVALTVLPFIGSCIAIAWCMSTFGWLDIVAGVIGACLLWSIVR
jgi:hypothetical protein